MSKCKKIFGTLLLGAVLCLLPLFLGAGERVKAEDVVVTRAVINGENWEDKTRNDDGSILWDPDAAILTLTDATLTGNVEIYFTDIDGDLRGDGSLTVKLFGENSITSEAFGILSKGDMTIIAAEGASLTVNCTSEKNKNSNALTVDQSLTLRGGTYRLDANGTTVYADENLTFDGVKMTVSSVTDTVAYAGQALTVSDSTFEGSAVFCLLQGQQSVTIDAGATVSGTSQSNSAIFSAGVVTVSGAGTTVDVTAPYCLLQGQQGVTVSEGAQVRGTSQSDNALYTLSGAITVTGQGTLVDVSSYYCLIQAPAGVTVSDGAKVTGQTSDSAIFSSKGPITVTGQGTTVDTTAVYCLLQGNAAITVSDGAKVTGTAQKSNAIYTSAGAVTVTGKGTLVDIVSSYYCLIQAPAGVTVSDGASVTGVSSDSAIFSSTGPITVTGQGTTVDATAVYCLLKGISEITVSDGATLTGTSQTNTAVYTTGKVTVTGKGTLVDVTVSTCVLQGESGVTVSDGAKLIGTSTGNSAVYTGGGALLFDGVEVELTCLSENTSALRLTGKNPITIRNSKLKAETVGRTIYSYGGGDIEISDSQLTLTSEKSNPLSCEGKLLITGETTTVTASGGYPCYGGTVTVSGATLTNESTRQALSAGGDITLSDGAQVTLKSTGEEPVLYSLAGNILIDGEKTSLAITAAQSGIVAADGVITLNAAVTVDAPEGEWAIWALESQPDDSGVPETRIILGERYMDAENIVATTVWKAQEDGSFKAVTLLVPASTPLNGQGLIEGTVVPARSAKIERYLRGDVNDDEAVNDADALYLLYFTFDPEGYPIRQRRDFNGDGTVNDADALYLLYHTFQSEEYPLH